MKRRKKLGDKDKQIELLKGQIAIKDQQLDKQAFSLQSVIQEALHKKVGFFGYFLCRMKSVINSHVLKYSQIKLFSLKNLNKKNNFLNKLKQI